MDSSYLEEEEMEVDLPSGVTISIAWDHESGPKGRFALVAFEDDWENRLLTCYAADIDELRYMVPWMVMQNNADPDPAIHITEDQYSVEWKNDKC
jgi:hypothetical protein